MVTIGEIAKAAGVSVATVSRVINGSNTVRPNTAARVRQTIAELHYVPNLSARNLRRNESRVILALAPNFTNPYYAHILAGIADEANALGYSMLNCTNSREGEEQNFFSMLTSHRADGAIILASNDEYDWLPKYAEQYPIVQCCEYVSGLNIASISIDNYQAARESMDYLLSLGHQKIAMISSVNNYISTKQRLQAYYDALEEANLEIREDYVAKADAKYSFESGMEATRKLLALKDPPTAIFCISDILALATIATVNELGRKVPEDITVMGFDDVDYTTMFHPYLTTVAQPCRELGRESMKLVAEMIYNGRFTGTEIFLPHQLIVRESTAKAE